MLEINGEFKQKDNDEKILNCILKFFTLENNTDKFLINHIKREIIFYLLTGKSGKEFIEKTVKFQDSDEIYKINSWIKENF